MNGYRPGKTCKAFEACNFQKPFPRGRCTHRTGRMEKSTFVLRHQRGASASQHQRSAAATPVCLQSHSGRSRSLCQEDASLPKGHQIQTVSNIYRNNF